MLGFLKKNKDLAEFLLTTQVFPVQLCMLLETSPWAREFFFTERKLHQKMDIEMLLQYSLANGFQECAVALVTDLDQKESLPSDIYYYIGKNNLLKVLELLRKRKWLSCYKKDRIVRSAVIHDSLEIVKQLVGTRGPLYRGSLTKWYRIDTLACARGSEKVFEYCAQHYSVDYHRGMACACQNDHTNIVKQILQSNKFDPSKDADWFLEIACKSDAKDVMTLLVRDKRINPRNFIFDFDRAEIIGYKNYIKNFLAGQQSLPDTYKAYVSTGEHKRARIRDVRRVDETGQTKLDQYFQ